MPMPPSSRRPRYRPTGMKPNGIEGIQNGPFVKYNAPAALPLRPGNECPIRENLPLVIRPEIAAGYEAGCSPMVCRIARAPCRAHEKALRNFNVSKGFRWLRGLATAETDTRLSSIYEPGASGAIVAHYSACSAISARLLRARFLSCKGQRGHVQRSVSESISLSTCRFQAHGGATNLENGKSSPADSIRARQKNVPGLLVFLSILAAAHGGYGGALLLPSAIERVAAQD